MTPVLHIEHLTKTLGGREILHDISFDTFGGEVFGFLGPNGAGKTTTIKIVAGLLTLERGTVTVDGHDLSTDYEGALSQIGAIVENPEFYKYMSGWDNLCLYANLRGVSEARVREMVHLVGLDNRIRERVGRYSLGMRQRLGVAQAMMHNPKLLILDEPTNGLDPAGIKALRDILKDLAHRSGVAVMVSSHLMSEMELMCDRVGIIVGGNLRSVHPIEELVAASAPNRAEFLLRVGNAERAKELLSVMSTVQVLSATEGVLDLTVPAALADETLAAVNRKLVFGGVGLYTVSRKENRRLEDVYIELTGEGGVQIG